MPETQRTPASLGATVATEWMWAPAGAAHALYAVAVSEFGRDLGPMPFSYGPASLVTIGLLAAVITAVAVRLWTHWGVRTPSILVSGWAFTLGCYILGVGYFATYPSEWVLSDPVSFPHAYGLSLLFLAVLVAGGTILERRERIVQELRRVGI